MVGAIIIIICRGDKVLYLRKDIVDAASFQHFGFYINKPGG